jgi:poly(A) polymerase
VGGCVRDQLLGREPKDFDVATDAHPEQVRELFRNCRLIGRRFRLAHVRFRDEIIEVATFRGVASPPDEVEEEDDEAASDVSETTRVTDDNVYGTIEEDALRRDFTVNALYYNIEDFSVVDYAGGMADLKDGMLRLIGDPEQRYREDPVRMLRAVRFAAKLGFRIHPDSEAPIFELAPLLADIPPARLFEEVLKLFQGGCALETYEQLRHYGLFAYLFPQTEESLEHEEGGFPLTFVARALRNTDERVNGGLPVTPAFLFAALLWEPLRERSALLQANGSPRMEALQRASDEVIGEQIQSIAFPRRFSVQAREIWSLQPRLEERRPKQIRSLLDHPRFRAAYDFLVLRSEAGEGGEEAADWWTRYQESDETGRGSMAGEEGENARGRRGRKPRRRRKGGEVRPEGETAADTAAAGTDEPVELASENGEGAAPGESTAPGEGASSEGEGGKRRRRRRRGRRGGRRPSSETPQHDPA